MPTYHKTIVTVMTVLILVAGCGRAKPTTTPTAIPTVVVPTDTPVVTLYMKVSLLPENLSAGDPYAPELGNTGYDVQHYTLRLNLDPSTVFVDASVTLDAVSTMDDLAYVSLDFVGFEISDVSLDGVPVSFIRQEDKLIVELPQSLSKDAPFRLSVVYSGEPVAEASIYVPFASHLGLHYPTDDSLFVIAEPDGARYWFPTNDHQRDKATYRFELVVPEGLTGVANGALVETQTGIPQAFPGGVAGDLYIWEHDYPVATAFVTVAVGDYRRVESTSSDGVLLRSYVFPTRQAKFEQMEDEIAEMIDWMSDLFGPYPFETFGFVTVEEFGGGLETQTLVVIDEEGVDNEGLLVHEMAHMWFGDWVSIDSWGDIWRSEGFATYVSYMWFARDNPEELEQRMASLREDTQDSGYPLDDPPPLELFARYSYVKGAIVVHALRQEMGDEAFFSGLRAYFERYGGGTATHAEFQAVLEEACGFSLDSFFEEWLE